MKRDQSEVCTPSSATPGEPPPAETPEAPPAAAGTWPPSAELDVIIPSAESKEVPDVPSVSEEQSTGLEPYAGRGGTLVRLSDGTEVPLEGFGQFALQLQALNPAMDWEDILPLAAQKLCQVKGFFCGLEAGELAFVATHGRRWRPGEGLDLPALIFDPTNPKGSCKVFRDKLKGTPLPHRDAFLERRIRECHEIYLQQREKFGQGERVPGFEGFIFVGKEIEGLKRYLRIRSVKSRSAKRARQLFLAGREKKF